MALTSCWLKEDIQKMFDDLKKENKGVFYIAKMSSAEREALFAKYSNSPIAAKEYNIEFEKKLILKKQDAAIKKWAEKGQKSGWDKTKKGKDLISRINRIEKILDPNSKKGEVFLESLAKEKLGFQVTQAESAAIFKAARAVNDSKVVMDKALLETEDGKKYLDPANNISFDKLTENQQEAIRAYAKATVEFQDIYDEVQLRTKTVTMFGAVSGFIKSLKASMDLSATFNQLGIVVQPLIWKVAATKLGRIFFKLEVSDTTKMQQKMLKNIFNYKKLATDNPSAILQELYQRPNYLNGNYSKAGIDIGIREEAYPSSVMQKLEAGEGETRIGRFIGKIFGFKNFKPYTRSENAYNLSIQVARADKFDLEYMLNSKDKEMFNDENIKKIGVLINQHTGRGQTTTDPKLNKYLSDNFFSFKFLMARIRTARDLVSGIGNVGAKLVDYSWNKGMADTKFGDAIANIFGKEHFNELNLSERDAIDKMRTSQAWKFMASAWTISFLVNLIGHGLLKDDPDWWRDFIDPTSTDFGKIRIGTVHWDMSMGINSLFVMVARFLWGKRKNQAGSYQKANWGELLFNFIMPKTAPLLQTGADTIKWLQAARDGKVKHMFSGDYEAPETYGTKIFGGRWILEQFVPMSLMNTGEAITDAVADKSWGTLALEGAAAAGDFFGISSSTYEDRGYNGYTPTQRTYLRSLVASTGENPPKLELDKNTAIMMNLEGEKREKAVKEFQDEWLKEFDKTINSASFLRLPADKQMERLKKLRTEILNKVTTNNNARKKKKK